MTTATKEKTLDNHRLTLRGPKLASYSLVYLPELWAR
jgi:hypothetical protein